MKYYNIKKIKKYFKKHKFIFINKTSRLNNMRYKMEDYKTICEKQEKHIDYLRNRCFNLIDELSRKTDEYCEKELKYIEEITTLKEQNIKLYHDLLFAKLKYGGNK